MGTLLGIDSIEQHGTSQLQFQQRRRLWCCMEVLDCQTFLDRGTLHLIPSVSGRPPLNVDDADLSSSSAELSARSNFTEMTFSLLTQELTACFKSLYAIKGNPDNVNETWARKSAIVDDLERSIKTNYAIYAESPNLLHRFTATVARGALVNIRLLLRRPLHRIGHCEVPSWDDFDVLKTGTAVLEVSLHKRSSEFALWKWFSWLKWHALAVVLAELCVPRNDELANKAFLVAQQSYADYAGGIADSSCGMLWKPIMRLMNRVQRVRGDVIKKDVLQEYGSTTGWDYSTAPSKDFASLEIVDTHTQQINGGESLQNNDFDMHFYNNDCNDYTTSWNEWDTFIQDVNTTEMYYPDLNISSYYAQPVFEYLPTI